MKEESNLTIHKMIEDLIEKDAFSFGISGTIDTDGKLKVTGVNLTRKEPETNKVAGFKQIEGSKGE